jgi:alpha-glucosidase
MLREFDKILQPNIFLRIITMNPTPPWWQTTSIYQIYPRSFADSNNDGIGDLDGIISKLDYIQDLGFETIWISPFFCSPQQDFGYDVSDYYGIAPVYGTLEDVERLIQGVHARGMRVLFDLVLNHTSIQHPWFQESRSNRDNPKRDWYIWRDPKPPSSGRRKDKQKRRPPNNWVSIPGGSGWYFDETTGQYYYASFLPFQPDLNWWVPEVKQAMFDVVRYWLDKGVDGFRLDIFHTVFKDEHFRDNPFSYQFIPKDDRVGFFQKWKFTLNRPEVFQLAKELRAVLDTYSPERMLIGEVFGSQETLKEFLGKKLDGLNLIFLWELLNVKAHANALRKVVRHYETQYPSPYTPVYVFGNHDCKRLISYLNEDHRVAKLLAMFQFTVRGVPVTYYGEEIGMVDGDFPAKTALDPIGRKYQHIPGFVLGKLGLYINRDGCRTPMQWDGGPAAGFCGAGATPWLPVHENYKSVNVQVQRDDEASIFNTYKKLLRLRREMETLRTGSLRLIDRPETSDDLLVYTRESRDDIILVVINFGKQAVNFQNAVVRGKVLFSIGMESPADPESFSLSPYSGVILSN